MREAETRHYAFVNQFIALVEQLFASPACRPLLHAQITPALAARALHAQLVGLFTDWTRDSALFDPLADSPLLIDSLLRGLVPGWQGPPA